jgi:hypothetical protein
VWDHTSFEEILSWQQIEKNDSTISLNGANELSACPPHGICVLQFPAHLVASKQYQFPIPQA